MTAYEWKTLHKIESGTAGVEIRAWLGRDVTDADGHAGSDAANVLWDAIHAETMRLDPETAKQADAVRVGFIAAWVEEILRARKAAEEADA